MSLATSTAALEQDGFTMYPRFALPKVVDELRAAISAVEDRRPHAGLRGLFRRCLRVATFASSSEVQDQLAPFVTERLFAVRGILFDKTPDANWLVAWHQDLTIAVHERLEVTGYGPWSTKEGVPHTQPPAEILERMLTLRLHLDDCDEANGALRVIPGSHCHGKLDAKAIDEWKTRGPITPCVAQAGDALLMRPLLLHSSSPASSPKHRRVIHLEFAMDELPDGLAWAERISE